MKHIVVLLLIFFSFFSGAQEKLGIVNSNYHPVSSIHFNASSSVDSRTYMQLNLAGVNAYMMNNAAYLPQFSFWSYLSTRSISSFQAGTFKQKKFLYGNVVADGPSFMMSKGRFGVGFFVRARSVLDARRIPSELTELFVNQKLPANASESSGINLRNSKISNMTWAEYGINFGMMIKQREFDLFTFGGNIKYLTGINLSYVNISNLQGDYGSGFININTLQGNVKNVMPGWGRGKGFALDLGATYKKMLSHVDNYRAHSRSSKCTYIDYKYKIGLSLRDLGYIRFGNSTSETVLGGSGKFYMKRTDSTYQAMFINNFTTERTAGKPITAGLPLALAGQFDYNFQNNVYLNLSINKSILPNGVTGVQSNDFLSVTPRFETKNLEVALPLTLQRFMYPQIGLAFRVRSFVVGVDNILPFVMKKNTYGAGVYFNLAIALFKNPGCSGRLRKVDDCSSFKKNSKGKNRKKSSLLSSRPLKH